MAAAAQAGGLEPLRIPHTPEQSLALVERTLNWGGYFCLTGSLRLILGAGEIVTAIGYYFYNKKHQPQLSNYQREKIYALATHGLVNIIRGTIEKIAILGGILLFAIDYAGYRYAYDNEGNVPKDMLNPISYFDWQRNADLRQFADMIKHKISDLTDGVKRLLIGGELARHLGEAGPSGR